MYNVKVLKYPSGYQYRVYSDVVGFHGTDKILQDNSQELLVWNESLKDYEYVCCDPDKMWFNLFSGEYERMPKEIRDPDREHSAKVSMNRTIKKIYHFARSNVWEWFFTLTFDPKKVDSFCYEDCTKYLSKWLNNLRRSCPNLRYLVVPEKHKSGRFHFHGLFAGCANIDFVDSCHKTKDGDIIYNIGSYRLGWSTATRVKDNSRVTKYLSKYISKDLCAVTFGKKRYWASRNLEDVEPVEMLLSRQDLDKLMEHLKKTCLYQKKVCSDIVDTIYFEMGDCDENS